MANEEKLVNVKPTLRGTTTRMNFSTINEVMKMPNLIEIQKNSYQWFLDVGLKEVFRDIGEITDFTGNLVLEFIDYTMDEKPKYTVKECKERDATYAAPLRVKARLYNKETGEVKESDVYMGDFPLMTESGTFVINGAERAIVSQLVRSPGVYFGMDYDKTGKELYTTTVIPNRGAWLEYETDQNDVFYVRIDKNRKIPITTFIRSLDEAYSTNSDILDFFGSDPRIMASMEKDTTKNHEEALLEVYKRLRPGEPPTLDSAQTHLQNLFFDPHRYDLSRVGRYKYNKKLCISDRLTGHILAQDVIDEEYTGEVLAEAGEVVTRELAYKIEQAGITRAVVKVEGEREVVIISNGMVDIAPFLEERGYDISEEELENVGINERVCHNVLMEVLDEAEDKDDLLMIMKERADDLIPKTITNQDILASISYLDGLDDNVGTVDDIDHLGNRRIRSVGELLQNQFRIGFTRMERVVRERMGLNAQDPEKATPQALINIRPVVASIREFFGSSPLSQFMDQTNPLAELTRKRRLSALGPGGLSRDRAGFEVRDVHYTHYGRMCPIETPEGPNIGLISYLATFARINKYGFIEAPYRRVDKETGVVLDEVTYMTADVEDHYHVAQANEPLTADGKFKNKKITCRYRDSFEEVDPSRADYMDVSPKMLVSVATAMIPFLENDDANRALMGSNMQRQAVPLMVTQQPIVGTGMEYKAAVDSGTVILAKHAGTVSFVDATTIKIDTEENGIETYELIKFMRSNQGTCINQRPIVSKGQKVEEGQVIADGPATSQGEISLGKNALIGFTTWEGYNYEDAVLLNENLVKNDVYTSLHIEEHETEARDTKLGPEEITRDIPNVGEDALANLDDEGIIRIGAEVRSGDILVGKVTPKGETELTAEERLLRAIFGEKAREVRDTSLRLPHGEYGIVVNVEVFTRENSDELSPGVNKVVRVYIAQKRKIQVGDKMAGRHGNKGVVSRILPQEDMPFLEDGTPLDICLNPLGIPSRMNIGQVLEVNLGMAGRSKGWKMMTPVFDGAHEVDIQYFLTESMLLNQGSDQTRELVLKYEDEHEKEGFVLDDLIALLKENTEDEEELALIDKAYEARDGKTTVYDGRTGKPFGGRITVGVMYYLKLHHLVDDKIHARSTGPYSLVTQQPLGGKAQFGGQRFGEMEVWALEAYGAAYTLQEILTVKSDDIVGRVKTYEAIVKGESVPKSGVPESFKVLIKELQALGLDIKVLDKDQNEIDLRTNFENDDIGSFRRVENEDMRHVNDAEKAEGYSTVDENGEPEVPAANFDEGESPESDGTADEQDTESFDE